MPGTSVYVDSSVWNSVFDDHFPELQAQTRLFFERCGSDRTMNVVLSDVVLQEVGHAPPDRLDRLAELIRQVNPMRLDLDAESNNLAEAYIKHGIVTTGHRADARHVAIATVAGVRVLTSWNYRHLVNRRRREAFNGVNAILGYPSIEIISPPEVFDE